MFFSRIGVFFFLLATTLCYLRPSIFRADAFRLPGPLRVPYTDVYTSEETPTSQPAYLAATDLLYRMGNPIRPKLPEGAGKL